MSESDRVDAIRTHIDRVQDKFYLIELCDGDGLLLVSNVEVDENRVLHYWVPGGYHGVIHPDSYVRAEEKPADIVGTIYAEGGLAPASEQVYEDMKEANRV